MFGGGYLRSKHLINYVTKLIKPSLKYGGYLRRMLNIDLK
jgi:hypothetical protein